MRCDIDALPIAEETRLPFASRKPGVMHACGHDAHTAVLMGLAEYFSTHRERVLGTIKFVFQQGEEKAPGKTQYPAHNARFDIHEEAMIYAMETMLIAYDELTHGKAADILQKNH